MNIRHKDIHAFQCEVIDECASFYVASASSPDTSRFLQGHGYHALSKSVWEPVPAEDRWEDVTAQVQVRDMPDHDYYSMAILYPGEHANGTNCTVFPKDYRLRKVRVQWFDGVPIGQAKAGHAFIIERKVSS